MRPAGCAQIEATLRSRARLLWIVGCAVSSVLLHASCARALDASEIRTRLRVEPGVTCLTATRLAHEVEPLLEDVRIPDDLLFAVEGSELDPRDVRLRVVRDERTVAERVFEPGPERCDRLHAAVGLAIALAINAAHEPEPPALRAWSGSASGLWSYGVVPQFAPGIELLVRRDFGQHVRLRAGPLALAAFDVALAPRAGTFTAALFAARADGCARTGFAPAVRAGACAGLLGGALYAAGDDVGRATSAVVPWLALSLAVDLELVLSPRWSLGLGFSSSVLLHRVEVGIEDSRGTRLQSQALDRVAFAIAIGPVYYF